MTAQEQRTDAAALRRHFDELVAADRQRRAWLRSCARVAGYIFMAALAGSLSLTWAWHYHWSRWSAWAVSALLTVACLAAPLLHRGLRRG